jgi:hypothetical protein
MTVMAACISTSDQVFITVVFVILLVMVAGLLNAKD